MRRAPSAALPAPATGERHDWQTLKSLFPFIWAYKGRVLFALACLVAAKGANVSVPIVFKHLIDGLTITPEQAFIVVPAALLLAYGALRFSTSLLTFGRVVIEAQAMGRPVVAADRFGARDLMIEGETGWVVPPDEPGRLTDLLRHILALTGAERTALADRAMPYARGRFSREMLGEAIVAVYEDVLAEARAVR